MIMKIYLTGSLFLIIASTNGLAQDTSKFIIQKTKKPIYAALNVSYTNKHFVYGFGALKGLRNNWSASIGIKWTVFNSPKMPADYEPGLILFGNDGIPDDIYAFYSLSIAKDFNKKNHKVILGIEAGLTYLENTISTNFTPQDRGTGLLSDWASNYSYKLEKKRGAGLLVKPKLKFLLSKKIGIETSVWTILNKIENYYGFEVSLLIGRLR